MNIGWNTLLMVEIWMLLSNKPSDNHCINNNIVQPILWYWKFFFNINYRDTLISQYIILVYCPSLLRKTILVKWLFLQCQPSTHTHACMHERTNARTHARTHTHAHTHTHTEISLLMLLRKAFQKFLWIYQTHKETLLRFIHFILY